MVARKRCSPTRCYSRNDLLKIKSRNCVGITRRVRRFLFILRLLRECSFTHHVPVQRPIPVRVTSQARSSRRLVNQTPRPRILRNLSRQERHDSPTHRYRSLRLALFNVRSLEHKLEDLLDYSFAHSFDIVLLTETWHDSDSNCVCILRQRGFNVVDCPRPRPQDTLPSMRTNHGGLVVFSSVSVPLTVISLSYSPTSFECICFRVSISSSSGVFLLIYRTGSITSLFYEELSFILDQISFFSCPVTVCGDLNFHLERNDDQNTIKLNSVMSLYGFSCQINQSTHQLGGTLDAIFTSTPDSISVDVSDPGLSDHFLLSWQSDIPLPPLVYTSRTFRNWSRLDLPAFRHFLENSLLCIPASWEHLSVSDLADLYNVTIIDILDQLLPFKTSRFPLRPSNQWFDNECHDLKRHIRRVERYLNDSVRPPPDLLRQFTIQRLEYRSLLRKKRSQYWHSRVSSQHLSSRSFWRSVDTLMGRGRSPPPHEISATEFLDFFLSKVEKVRHQTSSADPPIFSPAKNNCRFSTFRPISEYEVFNRLLRLPDKHSKCDPIPTSVLKQCADLLTPFLCFLFNLSLHTGSFPTSWKQAYVSPIPKKLSTLNHELSSFRPISHLPALSKMMEKLVSLQLLKYISDYQLLPMQQSAYRKHFSCETAVLKVVSDMLKSLDDGKVGVLALLDLSSAFDCVDHSILSLRLQKSYGVEDICLKWFQSFLSNREMAVSHFSVTAFEPVVTGVPQGSVLGPIIFSLYISDIVSLVQSHSLDVHLFADDIIIYGSSSSNSMSSLSIKVSRCLDDVSNWLRRNGLLLNSDKTKVMWYSSPRRRLPPFPLVTLDNAPVLAVDKVKYLGVVLDSHLSFRDNVSLTARSCFSVLRRIRSVKSCLPNPLIAKLISSLVFSRLDYCLSVHTGLPATTLWRLQRVLHASARLLHGIGRTAHVSPALRDLGWLSIPQRIELRLACLSFLCVGRSAPAYLSDQLQDVASVLGRRRLRSAASGRLAVPRVRRRTLGGRAFGVSAASAWNSLPTSLRSDLSFLNFRLFKSSVKKFLLHVNSM